MLFWFRFWLFVRTAITMAGFGVGALKLAEPYAPLVHALLFEQDENLAYLLGGIALVHLIELRWLWRNPMGIVARVAHRFSIQRKRWEARDSYRETRRALRAELRGD